MADERREFEQLLDDWVTGREPALVEFEKPIELIVNDENGEVHPMICQGVVMAEPAEEADRLDGADAAGSRSREG
jgi:hypothetical protein